MTRILKRDYEDDVYLVVMEAVTDDGLVVEEIVPGLMVAAKTLLKETEDPEQALDEAIEILEEEEKEA